MGTCVGAMVVVTCANGLVVLGSLLLLCALSAVTSVKTISRPYTAERIMRPGNRNACTNHISARQATVSIIKTQRIGWKKIASRPNTGSTTKNSISSS